jgi:ABC-type multidrug transport system ATPase subunit
LNAAEASPGAPAFLSTRGLQMHFSASIALDGVDLDVAAGERVLLLGANGAGKSTFLRAAAGLIRPTGGRLQLFGADPWRGDRAAIRRRMGLLSHQTFLYDHLTAAENLIFYGRLYGLGTTPADARRALDDVGLADRADDPVRDFSRGMQQRAAIARAVLHGPDLLLLDEPFTGLDAAGRETLQRMLRDRFGDSRHVFLMATHDLAPALPLATRVVVLEAGRVTIDREAAGLDAAGLEALVRTEDRPRGREIKPAT